MSTQTRISKKQRILEQGKKKYKDTEKVKKLVNAGGSLSTNHKFDVTEASEQTGDED